MSRADSAWLHMEEPTNLMMITALFTFKRPLDRGRLRKALEDRLLTYDRFAMQAVSPRVGRPYWKNDHAFELDKHIEYLQLTAPGGETELLGLVSDFMSAPLERDKPLWMFHVVDGFEGGSALIVRLHHAIADGIALMKVLLSLTDPAPDSTKSGEDLLEAPVRRTATLLHKADIKDRKSVV